MELKPSDYMKHNLVPTSLHNAMAGMMGIQMQDTPEEVMRLSQNTGPRRWWGVEKARQLKVLDVLIDQLTEEQFNAAIKILNPE